MGNFHLLKEQQTTALVLVVDDDLGMRRILRQQMEAQGYQVIEAEDGSQALAVYQRHLPDVVLLDAFMPVMDGFTCCHKLSSLDTGKTTPILMTTSLDDEESVSRAFAAGATDYITKPINWAILRQRVRRLIQQSRLMQQLRQSNSDLEDDAQARNVTLDQSVQVRKALEFELTLKRITHKVRDSLDEAQIVQTTVQELAWALDVKGCRAKVNNPEQEASSALYEFSANPESTNEILSLKDVSNAYQSLEGQFVRVCPIVPSLLQKQIALFTFPIQNRHSIGDLWLICESDRVFDDLEVRLVEQVVNQCAIGVEQARLYRAAQAQVQELERLNKLKDDFLSTVSHELRSPVTNMRLAIQFLERLIQESCKMKGTSPDLTTRLTKSHSYVQILQTECEREISLLNDLLDLQRLEAGKQPFNPVAINLQEWLPQEIEPFVIRAQARQQTLRVYVDSQLPPLNSDLLCLRRILTELINNACKYAPIQASITVTATTKADKLRFQVINTGVEISSQELTRIFDKFYRIVDGDRWQQGGTGLGLALVKHLVEHSGGSVQATSSTGRTCFTVDFPI